MASNEERAFFAAKNLHLSYRVKKGELRAVDGVSFEIEEPGQSLAIVGESACGKTSLARAILRMLPPNVSKLSGEVWLEGRELLSLPEREFHNQIRWKKISWVPQEAAKGLNPVITIGSHMRETLKVHGVKERKHGFARLLQIADIFDLLPDEERNREAERLLKMVGLSEAVAKNYLHQLSGGMNQRVCIAMALPLNPALVILDEPTSALDVSIQGQIIHLLAELRAKFSLSYLFISHNIALAKFCDFFAVMYAGKIVEKGKTEEVLKNPLHPYTKKLLVCTPRLDAKQEIDFIQGEPPDLRNPPSGCRFHPRCPIAEKGLCDVIEPVLEEKESSHLAACHKV